MPTTTIAGYFEDRQRGDFVTLSASIVTVPVVTLVDPVVLNQLVSHTELFMFTVRQQHG